MKQNWKVEKVENKDARFIGAWNALLNSWRAEVRPGDPPYPSSVDAQSILYLPDFIKVHLWVVWDEDREKMLGMNILTIIDTAENRDLASMDLTVHRDHRRKGIGTALLAASLPALHAEGRRRITGETESAIPEGADFLRGLGGRTTLEAHTNQLDLRELDRSLLQKWLAAAESVKPEFELGLWGNQYPEDQLEGVAHLYDLVNDQPFGEIEMERWKFTPDLIREMNRQRNQGSAELWTYYLREKATGNYVGYTEIAWRPEKDFLAQQGMTAVDPAYRNRGLGRWLKASMLEKLMRERPQVRYVRTGNADSNAPMLKINQALGFKPYSSNTQWELTRDGIEAYLASRQPI